jgi:hypothetical protein
MLLLFHDTLNNSLNLGLLWKAGVRLDKLEVPIITNEQQEEI